MVTTTYGIITCAMLLLVALVAVPYFFINIACYWSLHFFYRQAISKRSLLYLELITIPLLLFGFVFYVRYAHSLEGCIILLLLIYIITHTIFLGAFYPNKKLSIILQMVGISLVMTCSLMAVYIAFIFNPLCSLIG